MTERQALIERAARRIIELEGSDTASAQILIGGMERRATALRVLEEITDLSGLTDRQHIRLINAVIDRMLSIRCAAAAAVARARLGLEG